MKIKTKQMMVAFLAVMTVIFAQAGSVFASDPTTAAPGGTEAITKPLEVIRNLSISIVGSIGAILVVWAVLEIAQALQGHDTAQLGVALKRLIGGVLCASVAVLLALFGV